MKNDYLTNWISEASLAKDDVKNSFLQIREEELNWKPTEEQWSVGELLDHIIVTNSHYITRFESIAAGDHNNPFGARFRYLSDFFGKSVLKSVDPENTRKLKTVRIFHPKQTIYSIDLIAVFDAHQEQLIELVKATDFTDHQKTFITSPSNPMIVYSLSDAINIVLAHERRHIAQAKNLLSMNFNSLSHT